MYADELRARTVIFRLALRRGGKKRKEKKVNASTNKVKTIDFLLNDLGVAFMHT